MIIIIIIIIIIITGSSFTYRWYTERSSSKYIINHINKWIKYVLKLN